MTTINLDLQMLRNAIGQLDQAVADYAVTPEREYLRDALIMRFSFTFSQAMTALARYLHAIHSLPDAHILSPRQLIRHAARLGIIDHCEAWLRYVANRNRVSHAYLEPTAIMVAQEATAFATQARALLDAMTRGIANDA